jgi:PAS domain S-box-containing protein
MLRYVLDQSRDCVKILSPEGNVDYINSEGRCALEITDFSTICGRNWSDLWPEDSREIVEKAIRDAIAGNGSMFEAWRADREGRRRCWRISVSPLVETDGELAGILTISRDVTEDALLRESERTLALELGHRLRNAYTIASAIVMQSARGDAAAAKFAEAVCSRLADVAISQTKLLEAGEKVWSLPELIRTLVEAHGEGAAGILFVGDADARADGQEATLIALVVGELTNNSIKHGALRRAESIKLTWTIDGGTLTLHWREGLEGSGASRMTARNGGSGYALMERMAKSQGATFSHAVALDQLCAELRLAKRKG